MAAADRQNLLLPALVGVVQIPVVLGSAGPIFNDGDVSWHIATGRWILEHRAIPRTDPFSFTWAGQPWVPIEWLAEVLMAAVHGLAGYGGVAALVTAALIALHAVIFFHGARFVSPWVVVAGLVAMDLVMIPTILARPHVLGWALIAVWTWLMLEARERDRAPPLAAALLMAVWANLHGSFALGLVIAAFFGLEAILPSTDRGRALRQWGLFGAACAAAVLLNANGIAGVLHPLKIANLQMLPLITEWKPSDPRTTPVFFLVLALALALIAWKRPKMHPLRWLLLIFLLAMALLQMRHQAVLAIVAALLLPPAFGAARTVPTRSVARIAGAVAAVFVALRAVIPANLPDNSANPWKLIAAVPPELRSQPVLNGYSMGGPLILSGIRPYIDGRADMYGDELVVGYKRIIDGDAAALGEAVVRYGIRWAMIPADYRNLSALLDRSPEWRRIRQDEVGTIYVRD